VIAGFAVVHTVGTFYVCTITVYVHRTVSSDSDTEGLGVDDAVIAADDLRSYISVYTKLMLTQIEGIARMYLEAVGIPVYVESGRVVPITYGAFVRANYIGVNGDPVAGDNNTFNNRHGQVADGRDASVRIAFITVSAVPVP
jgi:hypothetical protein